MIRRIAAPALAALTLAASTAMPLAAGAAPKDVAAIAEKRTVPLLRECGQQEFLPFCLAILGIIERQIEEFKNRF
ncbi:MULTISPECIES: hypothetical protein [unclassified Cyanobium]|uniref:hypothetical protein n=1 Tax=unclassified Cyanobium TaxID=2627006 RepID=UPI0020CE53E5|nr:MULTISPECIES: hypothetical protein [unclassified Cyanobium]MCP9777037.1 hypothetical protein [Cyanobium sp. Tous-M-B4]MCP9877515.1 hypothetical protein [Cyanobium sp. A2C-AMD]